MATFGHGTQLFWDDSGTADPADEITGVVSIDQKKVKKKKIGTTHLGSTNLHETCRPGLTEANEVKVKMQYDKTLHAALLTAYHAGTQKAWKVLLADSSKLIGEGYISEIDDIPKIDSEDILYAEFSIQPVSKWPFTAA